MEVAESGQQYLLDAADRLPLTVNSLGNKLYHVRSAHGTYTAVDFIMDATNTLVRQVIGTENRATRQYYAHDPTEENLREAFEFESFAATYYPRDVLHSGDFRLTLPYGFGVRIVDAITKHMISTDKDSSEVQK